MNMSYCRWENTMIALRDCYYTLNDPLDSNTEIESRDEVIELCRSILEEAKKVKLSSDGKEDIEEDIFEENFFPKADDKQNSFEGDTFEDNFFPK